MLALGAAFLLTSNKSWIKIQVLWKLWSCSAPWFGFVLILFLLWITSENVNISRSVAEAGDNGFSLTEGMGLRGCQCI